MSSCGDVNQGELGPIRVDYEHFHCSSGSFGGLVILLYFVWVIFLIYLMGNTAKSYFSPTLGLICERLKLSYDVAGNSSFTLPTRITLLLIISLF